MQKEREVVEITLRCGTGHPVRISGWDFFKKGKKECALNFIIYKFKYACLRISGVLQMS